FFFSSRRRHTRFSRDWSSDVCSSDLPDEIAQLWAEAYQLFMGNSKLDLSDEMKVEAERVRENHMYYDPDEGKIEEYLNMPRPADWGKLTPQERFDKFKLYLALDENEVWEGQLPEQISPIEIYNEIGRAS